MKTFDSIFCSIKKPDEYGSDWYQLNCLDCDQAIFEVNEKGRLIRLISGPSESSSKKTFGDMHYEGMLVIYDMDKVNRVWHEYNLEFIQGTLVAIHSEDFKKTEIFEPTLLS